MYLADFPIIIRSFGSLLLVTNCLFLSLVLHICSNIYWKANLLYKNLNSCFVKKKMRQNEKFKVKN